jgi:1-hydroxycarotenoid 3,4-desaturase
LAGARVVIVGAGVAGLVAAALLSARGVEVVVLEREPAVGGKLQPVEIGGTALDAGPTVLTMRWVLDEIFAEAGASLADRLELKMLDILARHAWSARERLDLHADVERSADAIGTFAGAAAARGYRAFCTEAAEIYRILEGPFIRGGRPSLLGLIGRIGPTRLQDLWQIKPYGTMWSEICRHFTDPRLRQLFARYATYCGSSPFEAPGTLMLVAHVEQRGVWSIAGGMHRLAGAIAQIATENGARIRPSSEVAAIRIAGGRASGVRLADGEEIAAAAVLSGVDIAALAAGLLGPDARVAVDTGATRPRSLSAVTWSMRAEAEGFPLTRHNVFFGPDYAREFADIACGQLPSVAPTVYVCAQDRHDTTSSDGPTTVPLHLIVNAPATGDTPPAPEEIDACEQRVFRHLETCGLRITTTPGATVRRTPADYHRLYPGTGGALYGAAAHGWQASFRRPSATTPIPGLFLAGGSVHPGPGVPMAALSGRIAAAAILTHLASSRTFRGAAMPGGTSTA